MRTITINNKLTDKDLLHFNKIMDKNRVFMKMKIHLVKVFLRISNTHLKGKTRHIYNFLNQTGGSFDLMESSPKEEAITVHLQTKKSFMFMAEKILESAILIIYGASIFLA